MVHGRIYSSNEVCKLFDISKTTLFRWEKEGTLRVPRDLKGRRLYSEEHIQAINQRLHVKQFERVVESEVGQREAMETRALAKFLGGDMTGLFELAEHPRLSFRTIRGLLKVAVEKCEPGEPTFREIIEVIHRQISQETEQEK